MIAARCECGAPRRRGAEACDGCAALDGDGLGRPAQTLLAELRVTGPATWEQLGVDMPYVCRRQVMRGAAELERDGRLRRVPVEMFHDFEKAKTFFGNGVRSRGFQGVSVAVMQVELVERGARR